MEHCTNTTARLRTLRRKRTSRVTVLTPRLAKGGRNPRPVHSLLNTTWRGVGLDRVLLYDNGSPYANLGCFNI